MVGLGGLLWAPGAWLPFPMSLPSRNSGSKSSIAPARWAPSLPSSQVPETSVPRELRRDSLGKLLRRRLGLYTTGFLAVFVTDSFIETLFFVKYVYEILKSNTKEHREWPLWPSPGCTT